MKEQSLVPAPIDYIMALKEHQDKLDTLKPFKIIYGDQPPDRFCDRESALKEFRLHDGRAFLTENHPNKEQKWIAYKFK